MPVVNDNDGRRDGRKPVKVHTLGSFVYPDDRSRKPVIKMQNGGERVIDSIRPIPQTEMVEVVTVPDLADKGKARKFTLSNKHPLSRVHFEPKPRLVNDEPVATPKTAAG